MGQQQRKKSLIQGLVVLISLGSLLGLSSVPASAAEDPGTPPEWTLEVDVDDTTPPGCTTDATVATWSPDLIPVYPAGNDVDRFSGPALSVQYLVDLRFTPGEDRNLCSDSPDIYHPTGTVEALFIPISAELSSGSLECSDGCSAEDLSTGTSTIGGTILVADDAAGGINVSYTATLKVVWTPAA